MDAAPTCATLDRTEMFRVTSVSDIAGQVTAGSSHADQVSCAAVYLPSGALTHIRRRIPNNLPKWRDATDRDVKLVVRLLRAECLSIGVGSIDKTTDKWRQFWEDAHDAHSKAASTVGASIGYMKAATFIKFFLFGCAASAGLGHGINKRHIHVPMRPGSMFEVEEDLILDNEIQGEDNRDALVTAWRSINANQPLTRLMGISRVAKTLSLKTEQTEPLLLLADYVAGLQQVERSTANVLSKSKVSKSVAISAIESLRQTGRIAEFTGQAQLSYFEIYPEFKSFARRSAS